MKSKLHALRTVLALYGGQHRNRALLGVLLALIAGLSAMGLLAVAGWFITATAIAGLTTATAIAFNVFGPSAAIRLFAMLRTAGRYGERVITHDTTLSALADLRSRLFLGWSSPNQARELFTHPARLLFRLTTDVDALDGVYLRLGIPWLLALASIVLVGFLIVGLNGWFALLAVIWLVATTLLITRWQLKHARWASLRQIAALEKHRMQSIDLVSGQTDLLMTQRLTAQTKSLTDTQRQLFRAETAIARTDNLANLLQNISLACLTTAAMWCFVEAYQAGTTSLAWGVLILLSCLALNDPLMQLRQSVTQATRTALGLKRLTPAIERITTVDTEELTPKPATNQPSSDTSLVYHLCNVTLQYEESLAPVISDLSLEIRSGEHIVVTGTSGSGKSTLLAALAAELDPQTGELARYLPSTRLTQFPQLLNDTIGENLRIANQSASDDELWDALAQAGLADALKRQGQDLETRLGESGLGLSVGQQRRLTLARLLLANQPVWLLDEPSDGLDAGLANDVMQRLFAHAEERTIIVATHLRREALHADRILTLDQGRLIQDCTRGQAAFETIIRQLRAD